MIRQRARYLAAGWVLALATPAHAQTASAGPMIDSLRDLGPALTRCWQPPDSMPDAQLTVVLSLNRNGAILGRPRISFSKLPHDPELARTFVASALGSLAVCTPVRLSPGLGGAIAGRPLAIRFSGHPSRVPGQSAVLVPGTGRHFTA